MVEAGGTNYFWAQASLLARTDEQELCRTPLRGMMRLRRLKPRNLLTPVMFLTLIAGALVHGLLARLMSYSLSPLLLRSRSGIPISSVAICARRRLGRSSLLSLYASPAGPVFPVLPVVPQKLEITKVVVISCVSERGDWPLMKRSTSEIAPRYETSKTKTNADLDYKSVVAVGPVACRSAQLFLKEGITQTAGILCLLVYRGPVYSCIGWLHVLSSSKVVRGKMQPTIGLERSRLASCSLLRSEGKRQGWFTDLLCEVIAGKPKAYRAVSGFLVFGVSASSF